MTQQKETLNEFVNRRMAELGLGYKDVQNAGIGAQTQVNIRQGKVAGLQEVTKQKLALLLKCSQGEINAAIANTVQVTKTGEYVIRQSAEPSVMKTVDKLEQMVEEDYPELFTEEIGTKTEKSEPIPDKTDIKPDKSEPASSKTGIKTDDFEWQQEQPKPKRKKIVSKGLKETEPPAEKPKSGTVEEYRQKLKDMCLQQLSEADPFDADSTALFALIGQKLLKELMKK